MNLFQPTSRKRFIDACSSGDIDTCRDLYETCELDFCDYDVYMAFYTACTSGQIAVVNYLFTIYDVDISYIFKDVCTTGHLNMVKLLYEKYDVVKWCESAFSMACESGRCDIAKWIHGKLGMVRSPIISIAAINVCANGDLEFLQWILETYTTTRFNHNACLSRAIECGNLEIAQHLHKIWPNMSGLDNHYYFYTICRCGYLHMIDWFIKTYISGSSVPILDIRDKSILKIIYKSTFLKTLLQRYGQNIIITDNYLVNLKSVCELDNVITAHQLYDKSNQILTDSEFNLIIVKSAKFGAINVIKWLASLHNFTVDVLSKCYERALMNNHIKLAKWIHQQYPLIDISIGINFVNNIMTYRLVGLYEKNHHAVIQYYIKLIVESDANQRGSILKTIAMFGYLELLIWLLKKFDDVSLENINSAYQIAFIKSKFDVVEYLENVYPALKSKENYVHIFRGAFFEPNIDVVCMLINADIIDSSVFDTEFQPKINRQNCQIIQWIKYKWPEVTINVDPNLYNGVDRGDLKWYVHLMDKTTANQIINIILKSQRIYGELEQISPILDTIIRQFDITPDTVNDYHITKKYRKQFRRMVNDAYCQIKSSSKI